MSDEELANCGKRSFSRELFNDLTLAYMNDVDNVTTIAKTRIGEKDIDLRCNFAEDIPDTLYGDKIVVYSIYPDKQDNKNEEETNYKNYVLLTLHR